MGVRVLDIVKSVDVVTEKVDSIGKYGFDERDGELKSEVALSLSLFSIFLGLSILSRFWFDWERDHN